MNKKIISTKIISKNIYLKKYLFEIYFIFFIFLNIIDFLNIIGGDLDFFKKILSWTLISYLFYKVSITKIFIGNKIKYMDLLYILSFCLMTIPKFLILYSRNINKELFKSLSDFNILDIGVGNSNYYLFSTFLNYIHNLSDIEITNFLTYFLIIGILLSSLITIIIIRKFNYKKNSLLGSFNFSEYSKFIKLNYLSLIFISISFGFIIFNFFMEWFALAVDSLILVIGLFYYIIKFIKKNKNLKFNKSSKLLNDISNTGNNFLIKLLEMFSNKKTIFIGISFLLTLHLLVDFGVFIIPYAIGTQNTLYFSQISDVHTHNPLFSIFNFNNCNFYKDLFFSNFQIIDGVIIFIIYFFNLILFGLFLILPFYIYYKNVKKEKIFLNKYLVVLLISCLILYFMIILFNFNTPISIDKPSNEIRGIDIYSQQIFIDSSSNNLTNNYKFENTIKLILLIILFLSFGIFSIWKYDILNPIFKRLFYYIIIIFFITYIGIFFYSTIENEISGILERNILNYNTFDDYTKINNYLINNSNIIMRDPNIKISEKLQNNKNNNLNNKINIVPLLYTKIINNNQHLDYIKFNVSNCDTKNNYILVPNLKNIYFSNNSYNYKTGEIKQQQFQLIYKLGINFFDVDIKNKNIKRNTNNINKILSNMILFGETEIKNNNINIFRLTEYLRLFLISIFYLFGTIEFTKYYFKNNIFNK